MHHPGYFGQIKSIGNISISSSRSHSIFTMTVTMKDAQGDMRLGKLHLVC